MIVGALDLAGDAAGFTSSAPAVAVYAKGDDIEG